jgi:DNA-binding GntR family transcriptional regulator
VNHDRIKEGVTALTRDIMTMQAAGDYAKAKELGDRLGVARPPVQSALEKLADVPVDIEPRYVTAAELVK